VDYFLININNKFFWNKKEGVKSRNEEIVSSEKVKHTNSIDDNIRALLERIIKEPGNRYELEQEAGKLGRIAVNSLVSNLNSEQSELREASAIALKGIADNLGMMDLEGVILNAIHSLIAALQDNEVTVRKAVVSTLRMIIHRYYINTKLLDMLNPSLRNFVDMTINPLINVLDDTSIEVQLEAAEIFLDYGGDKNLDGYMFGDKNNAYRAKEIFVSCLDNEISDIRQRAAQKLKYNKDLDISKKVVEILGG